MYECELCVPMTISTRQVFYFSYFLLKKNWLLEFLLGLFHFSSGKSFLHLLEHEFWVFLSIGIGLLLEFVPYSHPVPAKPFLSGNHNLINLYSSLLYIASKRTFPYSENLSSVLSLLHKILHSIFFSCRVIVLLFGKIKMYMVGSEQ